MTFSTERPSHRPSFTMMEAFSCGMVGLSSPAMIRVTRARRRGGLDWSRRQYASFRRGAPRGGQSKSLKEKTTDPPGVAFHRKSPSAALVVFSFVGCLLQSLSAMLVMMGQAAVGAFFLLSAIFLSGGRLSTTRYFPLQIIAPVAGSSATTEPPTSAQLKGFCVDQATIDSIAPLFGEGYGLSGAVGERRLSRAPPKFCMSSDMNSWTSGRN